MAAFAHRTLQAAREATRSLLMHRLRAALSALGVVCGVVSFVLLISVSEGARRDTLARIGQLGIRNVLVRATPLGAEQRREARDRGSTGLIRADGARLMRVVPAIRDVAALREIRGAAEAGRHGTPTVAAITPNFMRLQGVAVVAGRALAEEDVRRRSAVCVVGEEAAHRLGREAHPGGALRIDDSICRVVGIFRRAARGPAGGSAVSIRDLDNAIFVPLGAQGALAPADEAVSELVVEFATADAVLPSVPALRRALSVAHHGVDDVQVIAPQELLRQAGEARRNFFILTGSIAIVALLVGGIGIMNTMLASVSERTREIGLRRAVGATRGHIVIQFSLETALLTAAGTIGGLVLGLLASLAVGILAGWSVAITAWSIALPAAAAMAAGALFGVYPALVASRMDPIEALRYA